MSKSLRVVKQNSWPRVTRYNDVDTWSFDEKTRVLTITLLSGRVIVLNYPQAIQEI